MTGLPSSVLLAGAVLAIGLLLSTGALAADRLLATQRIRRRVQSARSRALGLVVEASETDQSFLATTVHALGRAVTASRLLSEKTRSELELTLRAGGLATSYSLELFVGSKLLLAVMLPLGTAMLLRNLPVKSILSLGLIAGSAVLGLMLPNMIIGQRRKSYLAAIDRGLADGLDMMVICSEAGLALEATLQRVSVEVVHAHPKLAAELALTSSELGMASDSRTALSNMGIRTGLHGLSRLGTTMIQSLHYGTPLSAALRTLATELRQETLTRFEERAARLPVLLTLPMILFILPCVFLVVAGPIVIQVLKALKH